MAGVHALGAGNVTTRRHDAPVVPAADHRNFAQLRPVAFLDGGVESVAVEMGEGETMKLLVPQDARRSAGRADFGIGGRAGAAVTAQGFHGTIIGLDVPRMKMFVHGGIRGSDSNGAKSHVKGRSWDRLASQDLSPSVSQGTIWRYVAVDRRLGYA